MHQSLLMGMLQRQRRLVGVVGGHRWCQAAFLLQQRGQALALDELHDEEVTSVRLLGVVSLDNAGMR